MSFNYKNEQLDLLALTDKQKQALEIARKHGVSMAKAEDAGMNPNTFKRHLGAIRLKANKQLHELHDAAAYDIIPEGYHVKGASSQVRNADGLITWIKTDIDKEKQSEMIEHAIKAACLDIPRVEPVPASGSDYSDMLAVYPLGDPHIGMMSWEPETGMDWDIKIAKRKFTSVFDRLVKTAPPCKHALIVNLGDYFHADNMEGVTTRSGHHLDVDGRFAKMIEAGVFIIRRMIESALAHHEKVTVINDIGNHDDTSAMWLSTVLGSVYELNDRVDVRVTCAPFQYFEFGKVLIGTHHGHSCKMQNLPGVMAADQAKAWGRTDYRYWLTGHIHHDSMKEFPGVKCESFRTLAARDSYSAWGGYRSGQDCKCLIMHPEFGEVERHTVNLAMVN